MNMFTHRNVRLFVAAFIALFMVSCAGQQATQSTTLKIYAAVPPIAWLAGQVGGEHVEAHVLIESGDNPHVFEPTPRQLTDLGNADLYLLGSLPAEQRMMEKIKGSGAKVRIVDITAGIRQKDGEGENSDDGDDSLVATDPHIWLSPNNLKALAENIAEAFISVDPANSKAYHANTFALRRKIDDLQVEITRMLSPYKGEAVYVQHPAFGTFLAEFGLRQVAVEGSSSEIAAKHLSNLIESAQADGVTAIFTQPQFSDRGARTVADAIGAEVRHLDPLAADVLANLHSMAVSIRDELASRNKQEN